MHFRQWPSGFPLVVLICTLTFLGCSSERSGGQTEQKTQPETESSPAKTDHKELGKASWYGGAFQGQETASGETFDQKKLTAAHPSLPMGTKAEITNLDNGKKVDVTINDRGPYAKDRAIDLSSGAAKKLDMKKTGTANVKIMTKPTNKRRSSIRKKRPRPDNAD